METQLRITQIIESLSTLLEENGLRIKEICLPKPLKEHFSLEVGEFKQVPPSEREQILLFESPHVMFIVESISE